MARVRRSPRSLDLGLTTAAIGLGAWCSQGVLDRVGAGTTSTRVAMLPSLLDLAAMLAITAALLALLAATLGWLSQTSTRDATLDGLADWLTPLRGVAVLALPYLPWLPERLPLVHALAGPARWYVWAACVGVMVLRSTESLRVGRSFASTLVALGCVALFGGAAARLAGTPVFPGGDEPHYLVITQSLLTDRDFKIENNHDREDYRAYYSADLAPHYRTRGVDREIYSIHPVGLPVLLMPVFALGGYWGAVWTLVLCSCVVAWSVWRYASTLVSSLSAGAFAWAATFASPAFVFNSFSIYPEMVAALVTTLVFLRVAAADARRDGADTSRAPRWWVLSCGAAMLPWLSTKYAPLSAALLGVCAVRAWRSLDTTTPAAETARRWAILALPYGVSVACWFAFFYYVWGTPWPSAPYGADDQTSARFLLRGGPGLLLDQEYGVAASAPALLLAFPGLWRMFRAGGSPRRLAVEIGVLLAALWATVGAFELWWGGTAGIGRPVIATLGLLAIPIAHQHRAATEHPGMRVLHYLLLIVGLCNVAMFVGVQEGLLLSANRSGRSTLLEWLSPIWPIVDVFPSFIAQPLLDAAVTTALWIGAGTVVALAARRLQRARFGALTATLVALSTGAALATAALIAATTAPTSDSPLEARVRVPLLDAFDAQRRPLALRFDPLSRVPALDLLSGISLAAGPADGRPRPPIPLLYNARYSLPAGHYLVELVSTRSSSPVTSERLGLQLGRAGPLTQDWEVSLAAPGVWGRTFDLPVDVGLVGFKASEGLAAAGFSLRLRPMTIVDAHRRVPVGQVLSVKRYGAVVAVFPDERAWPEQAGFWVSGGETVRFLVNPDVPASGDRPTELVLRLHSGEIANTVVVAARGKAERLELFPKRVRTVVLPLGTDGATTITLAARDYFVPAARDPQSKDQRHLGCWVEIVGFEEPQASVAPITQGRS